MKNHTIKIILGAVLVFIGIFFFGENFIDNFLWKGCYDDGYPGHNCIKNNQATYKAYITIFFVSVGVILITLGIVNRKKP